MSVILTTTSSDLPRKAKSGDIVTIDLNLVPENGFVPESLIDTKGRIALVLGWGNYLPGLHTLLEGMAVGDVVESTSIDAGWGERRSDLILTVPKTKLKHLKDVNRLQAGSKLHLQGDVEALVTHVTETTITVDANPPLAGASYSCDVTVCAIESMPNGDDEFTSTTKSSPYSIATFALGCFWGAELAFMRMHGVVGTKVGYTQGIKENPSYEDVCAGTTKHREAVMVVYDTRIVSYQDLMELALKRLDITTTLYKINLFEAEYMSEQYKHGFYCHNDVQRGLAEAELAKDNRFRIELRKAAKFFDAEGYHQQYLLKGGQSARKDAKETIRCFG